jgi:hypothetical protein
VSPGESYLRYALFGTRSRFRCAVHASILCKDRAGSPICAHAALVI